MKRWRVTFHSHHRKVGHSADHESTDIDLSFDVEAPDRNSAHQAALTRVQTFLTPEAYAHFTGPDARWHATPSLGSMTERVSGHG